MKFAYFNPTVIAVEDVPSDVFASLQHMTNLAHQRSDLNDEGNQKISIRGGQQIQLVPNHFNLDTSVLKKYIEDICLQFLESLGKINGRSDLDSVSPVLVSAWTIKQHSGHYQALHNHEAHISGNIYIDVPDLDFSASSSDACIEFRFPVIRNPAQFIFADQWRFKPQPMKMIVFPSYIPHTVYPWNGQGNRTILAWDVKLVNKK